MSKPTLSVALLLAALVAGSAPALAQMGTQVRPGHSDHVPLTDRASLAVSVNEADLGQVGAGHDNCLLLDTATTAAAGAHRDDIRLTACAGKAAGTQLADGDTIERSAAYPNVPGAVVRYADADGSGKYDKGDPVYITTAAAGLVASAGTGVWTVRLTPVMGLAAGTFVHAGDADLTAYRTIAANLAASVTRLDTKAWYLVPTAAGAARDGLLRENSLRLAGPVGGQAEVKVVALNVTTEKPVAGQALVVALEVRNDGKAPGSALVSTKLDGMVVDARGTPTLDPGAKATLVATLLAPRAANATLESGELRREVSLLPATAPAPAGPAAAADPGLALRVSELEAEARGLRAMLELAREDLAELQADGLPDAQPLQASSLGPERTGQPRATPAAGALAMAATVVAAAALLHRKPRA